MGREKWNVREQVTEIDRMPHESIQSALHDAAVCGQHAEAVTKGDLASHNHQQGNAEQHRRRRFGNDRRNLRRPAEKRRGHRHGGDEPDDQPLVDDGRGTPQAREHDDERFTDEQQQIGGAARYQKIAQQPPRQGKEQPADQNP